MSPDGSRAAASHRRLIEDISGLVDAIRRLDRRPQRLNLPIRDRPPLWDEWLDGPPF